jgi:hypothetical protein
MLKIYVPRNPEYLDGIIAPCSAIVSNGVIEGNRMLVHYEGNLYGASNLMEFHGRLASAAGRLTHNYATTARAMLKADEMIEVAHLDPDRRVIVEIVDADALERWAGETTAQIAGAKVEPGRHTTITDPDYLSQLVQLAYDGEGLVYRSRSGQVVFAKMTGGFTVYEHDDPEVSDRLRNVLDEDRLKWVVGAEAASVGAAPPTF